MRKITVDYLTYNMNHKTQFVFDKVILNQNYFLDQSASNVFSVRSVCGMLR